MHLPRLSMGVGDRFGAEGEAQLAAFVALKAAGVEAAPVWNKSNREHQITGTKPEAVRVEADAAARALQWPGAYFVDADHIGLKNVDGFLAASDFFTLDVADFIGQSAGDDAVQAFVGRHAGHAGTIRIPGLSADVESTPARIEAVARKYLRAVQEAGQIYRRIAAAKGAGTFVTEVSMDEADQSQTPAELYFILAALAEEQVPLETVAPKFAGRFNKGVDYVGDVRQFEQEFNADLAVIAHAVRTFRLPKNLKLSVHSGSDKFSIYGPIGKALRATGAGLHLKTAGTTWLEEAAGLALGGGEALKLAAAIYAGAFARYDEMCKPYATVIDIDRNRLPSPDAVRSWSGAQFAAALRHAPRNPQFNPHFRQLLHVGYKVAAEMGGSYREALQTHRAGIGALVTENLFEKHMRPLFLM